MTEHNPVLPTTSGGFLAAPTQFDILCRIHSINILEGLQPSVYRAAYPNRDAYSYEAARALISRGLVRNATPASKTTHLQITALGIREIAYWATHPTLIPKRRTS